MATHNGVLASYQYGQYSSKSVIETINIFFPMDAPNWVSVNGVDKSYDFGQRATTSAELIKIFITDVARDEQAKFTRKAPAYAIGNLGIQTVVEKVETMFQPRTHPLQWHPKVWNGQKPK